MQFHDYNVKANKKLTPKEDNVIKWHTQAGGITTSLKVKIYFTLPELSKTQNLAWNCHVDDSAKGRYDMILGGYLLEYL